MDLYIKLIILVFIFFSGVIANKLERHLSPGHVSKYLIFNLGKCISFFTAGVIIGLVGFLFKINGFNGGILLFIFAAGVIIVTISHLPFVPKVLILGLHGHHHPKKEFPAGLLNVFASSATLHIVMIIALSHGYFLESGVIMLIFALGSLNLPGKKILRKRKLLNTIQISMFFVMSLFIINKALLYTELYLFSPYENQKVALVPEVLDNYQYLKTNIDSLDNRILIGNDQELNWMIEGNKKGDSIYIPRFRHRSVLNNEYEFLSIKPESSSFIYFTRKLGKGDYVLKVIDDIKNVYELPYKVVLDSGFGEDLCSSNQIPMDFNRPKIIVTEPAIAIINNNSQKVDIKITDEGYVPSVIVLKKDIPAVLNFIGETLNNENYRVVMPSFNEYLEFEQGDNPINIPSPLVDFSFYSWKGEHGGYVLVVDDLVGMTKEKAERQIRMFNANGI